jgi:5-methylcytosine-specific restriction endonuclease McrA
MKEQSTPTKTVIAEIQDFLAPLLDSYEQMLYHYLFRHSRLEGKKKLTIGVRTLQTRVGLGIGKVGSAPSQSKITKKLRDLEKKGCVKIHERSRKGTRIEVFVPREIPGLIKEPCESALEQIESLDFFNTPELRLLIFQREKEQCFDCLRHIDQSNFTLDHVMPQAGPMQDHSYKNVVACCFECNTRKQAKDARDFLRNLYRDGLLTAEEHISRTERLEELVSGKLMPNI